MTTQATAEKIITWALKGADAYGTHIQAINMAINSESVAQEVKDILIEKKQEWIQ